MTKKKTHFLIDKKVGLDLLIILLRRLLRKRHTSGRIGDRPKPSASSCDHEKVIFERVYELFIAYFVVFLPL